MTGKKKGGLLASVLALSLTLSACAGSGSAGGGEAERSEVDTARFLSFVSDDADTVDPQCTTEHYTVALNVMDRLVENRVGADGQSEIIPSLAESWEISPDGHSYLFHLRRDVRYSNGEALTASDVGYTLRRLLTHPDSQNQDIALGILGAKELHEGKTETLTGFREYDDYAFEITLERPNAAFLACLSMPGASILDETTTEAAGVLFGHDPAWTVGTGPFIFRDWQPGLNMILTANRDCWSGPPNCDGLMIYLATDPEYQRLLFENGSLDILDLDNVGNEAEYFIHGDIYQDHLRHGARVGISYIALNASVPPLNDRRVRKALQLALDRETLLGAAYSGRGIVENGIFPHGLTGFNPELPEIPYAPEEAKRLLREAGYPNGFSLTLSASSVSSQTLLDLLTLIGSMWAGVGVRAAVQVLPEEQYMAQRRAGKLTGYSATWSADYNDPDNFIYTFFGNPENTTDRSLCYPETEVMRRVEKARQIVDTAARLEEYRDLERRIVQEDAAWIPLFSRQHYFVLSDRVEGFEIAWNGWSSTSYRNVSIRT